VRHIHATIRNVLAMPSGKNWWRGTPPNWSVRWLASRRVSPAQHQSTASRSVKPSLLGIARSAWPGPALECGNGCVPFLLPDCRDAARAQHDFALRSQILPRWELVPLSRITHSDVSSWVHGLTDEGLAPATVRYAHRVLSLALTAAFRDGRLVRNVAEGVPLPPRRGNTQAIPHS
jgi:hypothetical protein